MTQSMIGARASGHRAVLTAPRSRRGYAASLSKNSRATWCATKSSTSRTSKKLPAMPTRVAAPAAFVAWLRAHRAASTSSRTLSTSPWSTREKSLRGRVWVLLTTSPNLGRRVHVTSPARPQSHRPRPSFQRPQCDDSAKAPRVTELLSCLPRGWRLRRCPARYMCCRRDATRATGQCTHRNTPAERRA